MRESLSIYTLSSKTGLTSSNWQPVSFLKYTAAFHCVSSESIASCIPSGISITSSFPVLSSCTVMLVWANAAVAAKAVIASKIVFFIFL